MGRTLDEGGCWTSVSIRCLVALQTIRRNERRLRQQPRNMRIGDPNADEFAFKRNALSPVRWLGDAPNDSSSVKGRDLWCSIPKGPSSRPVPSRGGQLTESASFAIGVVGESSSTFGQGGAVDAHLAAPQQVAEPKERGENRKSEVHGYARRGHSGDMALGARSKLRQTSSQHSSAPAESDASTALALEWAPPSLEPLNAKRQWQIAYGALCSVINPPSRGRQHPFNRRGGE